MVTGPDPGQGHEDADYLESRVRLLQLLRTNGILFDTPEQPIVAPDGRKKRWILDSLSVTLTHEGLKLAARCLLHRLEGFRGRTLATYGTTAVPLVSACVLLSGGRYRALLVRKERKSYGASKLIEGPGDTRDPVIMIDDSICSGRAMNAGREALEQAGYRVEGAVSMVRFGFVGGTSRMREAGYHMEAVFDIWSDFMHFMPGEPDQIPNPTRVFPTMTFCSETAPQGLHPARLARRLMESWLASKRLPRLPESLDREYDCAGGVFVSVRSREQLRLRHAREGFWHFPGEPELSQTQAVAHAALKAAVELEQQGLGPEHLASCSVAVTTLSELQPCDPGDLDNDRYGIVVCSRERVGIMGGALPRMPNIANTWRQLQHARVENAGLLPFEDFRLYRHEVAKHVEPGHAWQPGGVPLPPGPDPRDHDEILVAERALDLLEAAVFDREPTTAPLSASLGRPELLFITLYGDGHVLGCIGDAVDELEGGVRSICTHVLGDERFEARRLRGFERLAISASFLYGGVDVGRFGPEQAPRWFTFGYDALQVSQGECVGLMLPFASCRLGLGPLQLAYAVVDKAGITRPPYDWRRYETRSWLVVPSKPACRLEGMFAVMEPQGEAPLATMAARVGDYLLRQQEDDGSLLFRYHPFRDTAWARPDPARLGAACWVMFRAGVAWQRDDMVEAAGRLLSRLTPMAAAGPHGTWLEGEWTTGSIAEGAFLLLSLCAGGLDDRRGLALDLCRTLWSRIDVHGRVAVFCEPSEHEERYQDYAPGQVLLALACAEAAGLGPGLDDDRFDALARAFDYYRHRFRHRRDFAQVSWMMQAFATWWQVRGVSEHAEFVFEIGDWALRYQDRKRGCFYNDHQPDTPGFTTALYLEGIGAAHQLAKLLSQPERAATLREACRLGLRFMDRLVIGPRDAPVLPNPEWASGGVRQSLHASEVRIDFVTHTLAALLAIAPRAEDLAALDQR